MNAFPLFRSHLDLAHSYWTEIIHAGDTVIDATCGNGHDCLKLCQLTLSIDKGKVYAIDIQEEAIHKTEQLLATHLNPQLIQRMTFKRGCHSTFPIEILPESVSLIVYNLGYLPGGNKEKTTLCSTTLQSFKAALPLLKKGGVLSVTCYPGHTEGAREEKEILSFAMELDPKEWSACHHTWLNRQRAPSLLLIQRQGDRTPRQSDSKEGDDRLR